MNGPRIRQAGADDALLVAALVIQAARAQRLQPEPGFMDRFADAWLEYRDQHPTWWAELAGRHAGVLITSRTRALPWPGQTGGGVLRAERLFVCADLADQGIAESLLAAAGEWAAGRGIDWVARNG